MTSILSLGYLTKKTRIFFLLLIIPSLVFCRNKETKDSIIKYSKIIEVAGISKSELYQRAKNCITNNFNCGIKEVQIDNKEDGQIMGEGSFGTFYNYRYMGNKKIDGIAKFTLNILLKDNKYTIEIYDITFYEDDVSQSEFGVLTSSQTAPINYTMASKKRLNDAWVSMKKNCDTKCKAILEFINAVMFIPANW